MVTGVYLSACYSRKYEVHFLASVLRSKGVEIVSTWHDEPDGDDDPNGERAGGLAWKDCVEIFHKTRTFVSLTPGGARGFRHFEAGMAWALGRFMVLCGPIENHGHALRGWTRVPDVVALVKLLTGNSTSLP